MHGWKVGRVVLVITGLMIVFALLKACLMPSIPSLPLAANRGLLDIGGFDINHTLVEISGTAATYPGKLLPPSYFSNPVARSINLQWVPMPYAWPRSTGVHEVTQRFIIEGLIPGHTYGIQTLEALTAFRIWVDGNLIASNGVVSENPKLAVPESNPCIGLFTAHGSRAEVVMQVSDYEAHMMGLWQKIRFGTAKNIMAYQEGMVQTDAFLLGCLLIMALYHGSLYLIVRKDHAILCFALICGLVALKTIFSGQQLGYVWFPIIHYALGIRLAYGATVLIAQAVLCFARQCFPEEIPVFWIRLGWLSTIIQGLIIFVTPLWFFMVTFIGFQAYVLFLSAMLSRWVYLAIVRKREGAITYLIGFASIVLAAINDILYSQQVVKTGFILSLGLLVMIFAQSSMIAMRFRKALAAEHQVKEDLENLVEARTRELEKERNRFEHLSNVDGLTHLYNKRYLMEALELEFENFRRYGTPFSLVMADIDHFKRINDTFGHVTGDEVLVVFAEYLKKDIRRTDTLGRFGGEEFLFILRHVGADEAYYHIESLRAWVENNKIQTRVGEIGITASFGVAEITAHIKEPLELLRYVDQALYKAKQSGRNQVVIFTEGLSTEPSNHLEG